MLRRSTFTLRRTDDDPDLPPETVPRGSAALEQRVFTLAQLAGLEVYNRMIGIKVVVSYDGIETRDPKSNSLALDTTAAYDSEIMQTKAETFGKLIAAKLPTTSMALHAVIWRIDPATGGVAGEDSRTVPLNYPGKFVVPAGDRMAPDSTVVTITKLTKRGVGGRLNLRHVLTAKEASAYRISGTPPVRFTDPDNLGDGLTTNLLEGLKNLGDATHKLAVPSKKARKNVVAKLITSFEFGGIRQNQTTRPRTSGRAKTIKGAQQKINQLAIDARFSQRQDANGALPDGADKILKVLKDKALAIFNKLEGDEQSRIVWPTIFDSNPLTSGEV